MCTWLVHMIVWFACCKYKKQNKHSLDVTKIDVWLLFYLECCCVCLQSSDSVLYVMWLYVKSFCIHKMIKTSLLWWKLCLKICFVYQNLSLGWEIFRNLTRIRSSSYTHNNSKLNLLNYFKNRRDIITHLSNAPLRFNHVLFTRTLCFNPALHKMHSYITSILEVREVDDAEINDVMFIHAQICTPVLYNDNFMDSSMVDCHKFEILHVERWQFLWSVWLFCICFRQVDSIII